jgi:hypothetical protein
MAYITKNLLDGSSWRDRRHGIDEVTLKISEATCDIEEVRITISMTREDRYYHLLRLTNKDVEILLPEVLASLDESVFLKCMEQTFARKRKKRKGNSNTK